MGFWVLPPVVSVCCGEAPAGGALHPSADSNKQQNHSPITVWISKNKYLEVAGSVCSGTRCLPAMHSPVSEVGMCGSSWARPVLWGRAVAMGSAGGAVPTAVVSCVWCWCVRCRAVMYQHSVPQIEELLIAG